MQHALQRIYSTCIAVDLCNMHCSGFMQHALQRIYATYIAADSHSCYIQSFLTEINIAKDEFDIFSGLHSLTQLVDSRYMHGC